MGNFYQFIKLLCLFDFKAFSNPSITDYLRTARFKFVLRQLRRVMIHPEKLRGFKRLSAGDDKFTAEKTASRRGKNHKDSPQSKDADDDGHYQRLEALGAIVTESRTWAHR